MNVTTLEEYAMQCDQLLYKIISDMPKTLRYTCASSLVEETSSLLHYAVAIRKKRYKKTDLTSIDINIEVIRCKLMAIRQEEQLTRDLIDKMLAALDHMGCIVGNMLKTVS